MKKIFLTLGLVSLIIPVFVQACLIGPIVETKTANCVFEYNEEEIKNEQTVLGKLAPEVNECNLKDSDIQIIKKFVMNGYSVTEQNATEYQEFLEKSQQSIEAECPINEAIYHIGRWTAYLPTQCTFNTELQKCDCNEVDCDTTPPDKIKWNDLEDPVCNTVFEGWYYDDESENCLLGTNSGCETPYAYEQRAICEERNYVPEQFIFPDILPTHPNISAITFLKERNIIEGHEDGTFKPDSSLNRAELMKIAVLAGDLETAPEDVQCYDDVNNEWFAEYVCAATKAGWVHGFNDGTFKPEQAVTNAEALKIIIQAIGGITATTDNFEILFTDVVKDSWYEKYVQYAINTNILWMDNNDLFDPNTAINRSNTAETVARRKLMDEVEVDRFHDDLYAPEYIYLNPPQDITTFPGIAPICQNGDLINTPGWYQLDDLILQDETCEPGKIGICMHQGTDGEGWYTGPRGESIISGECNASMEFLEAQCSDETPEMCEYNIDPYDTEKLGIQNIEWISDGNLSVTAAVTINCGTVINSASYNIDNDKLELIYNSPECSNCTFSMCTHEMNFLFMGLETKEYDISLVKTNN